MEGNKGRRKTDGMQDMKNKKNPLDVILFMKKAHFKFVTEDSVQQNSAG